MTSATGDRARPDGGVLRMERPGPARLAWLDALRGIAALMVVFEHTANVCLPELKRDISGWVSPGTWGVLVFFLVSGYIVPASLERGGSVRSFWIGRLFRLYPLWTVAIAAAVLLAVAGYQPHTEGVLRSGDPAVVAFAHLAMLQTLLAGPSAIYVMWSLTFEMVFYLLVVALFTVRLHRRSAEVALGLALVSVLFGGLLPPNGLSRTAGVALVAVLGTVLAVIAITGSMTARRGFVIASALSGGLLVVVLLGSNSTSKPWEGLIVLAMMFLGTVVHRVQHGQISRFKAGLTAAAVLGCAVLTGVWHVVDTLDAAARVPYQRAWAVTVLLAALTFGVGIAMRDRRMPRLLTQAGVMSYSVYLLHPVLLGVLTTLFDPAERSDWVMVAGYLCVLLPVCWLTQRYVEAPGQRLGRRIRASRPEVPGSHARPG